MNDIKTMGSKAQVDRYIGNLDPNKALVTNIARLKTLDVDMRKMPKEHLSRWCSGGICACLGCANAMGWKSKQEWQDYTSWVKAERPENTGDVHSILMRRLENELDKMPTNRISIAIIN